jgi:glycosyltransferase involved in cell wall biosynthesis
MTVAAALCAEDGRRQASLRSDEQPSPLVSIVISNFNYERYIGQTIQAALDQSYGNIEVVVVDDGSSDGSRSVIGAFDSNERVKIHFQENAGQAAAINRGFALSSGEIVIFVDSDDLLKPEAVSTIVENWSPDLCHLQYPLEVIDGEGTPLGLHPFSLHMEDGDIHWQLVVAGHYRFMPTTGNAFSRAALQRILPMPAAEWRICADTYLVMLAPKAGPVRNLQGALGYYRIHDQNNWYTETRGADKNRTIWQNHVRVWRTLIRHIEPRPGEDKTLSVRAIRDRAALYHHRRILMALQLMPGAFSAKDKRAAILRAIGDSLRAAAPVGNKLLYLCFIALIALGGWRASAVRKWMTHACERPRLIKSAVAFLKGPDFYSWMRMRERKDSPAALPLGTMLRFGRNGTARAAQWYGWTRSDQYLDWCIGAEAALVFEAPDTKRPILVEMDVLPYTTGRLTAQRLQVVCNGEPVHQASLKKRDKVEFELPARLWQGKSRLELRFLTPDFVFPRLIKEGAEDYRPLSVAIGWIKFSIAGANQQAVRAPFLPVGPWLDAAQLTTAAGLSGDWRELPDGIVRMVRKLAHLKLSVLEPSAGDHLLTLEFAPEQQLHPVEVKVDESTVGLELSQRCRADILLRRGTIQKTGHLTVAIATNVILGANRRGFPGDSPAGPGLRRVRLQLTEHVPPLPILQSGAVLDFRTGGSGNQYLQGGWYSPTSDGVTSMDTVARVAGLWFDVGAEAFLTAQVRSVANAGDGIPQQLRILCNGALLARYDIDGPSEVTAIIPAGLIGADRRASIEFRTSSLLAADASQAPVGFTLSSLVMS